MATYRVVMVPVRELLDDVELGLEVVSGGEHLDREVRWAHVSELIDPTEFLEGGELLLLTGVRLPRRRDEVRDYVERLVEADVAALGYGIGVHREAVPVALVDACRAAGLPLLSVPRATPFLAITKAVSRAIAAREDAVRGWVHRCRERLTAAAVGAGGPEAVVAVLVRSIGGWAVLVDHAGALITAAPSAAAERIGALRPDLERLAATAGPGSLVSRGADGDEVWLQTLIAGQNVAGILVLGGDRASTGPEREVVMAAVSLLTLVLDRSRLFERDRLELEASTMGLLTAVDDPSAIATVRRVAADLWHGLPDPPIVVVECRGSRYALARARERLIGNRTAAAAAAIHARIDDVLIAVVPAYLVDRVDGDRSVVPAPFSELEGVHLGISDPTSYVDLLDARQQAARAADYAAHENLPAVYFAGIPPPTLLELVSEETARRFGIATLAPLDDELRDSLRAWLAHHGQWDPAATELGVHRHTLRNRIRRIERRLGYPLDSPTRRAELWLALQVEQPTDGR